LRTNPYLSTDGIIRESRLVQRLTKPRRGLGGTDNPFSFGGGLKNGGLSDDAMDLLRDVFSFEYMGAAEFEFGSVPDALSQIAKEDLTTFTITVPLTEVPPNWQDKSNTKPVGEGSIYVLCAKRLADAATERINRWARNNHTDDTKERVGLTSALRPYHEWDADTCGWLELNNGFMFFTDEDMFQSTCSLFGVETFGVEVLRD
jgi:hypothetical protein